MALDQRNNSKLMWIIVAGLVMIVTLAVVFLWISSKDRSVNTATIKTSQPVSEAMSGTSQSATPESSSEDTVVLDKVNPSNALVSESILKQDIPQNATFAKEEIAKLDEFQRQLQTQYETLESQQSDADQLIALKEEQIKLLEQQLSALN